MIDNHDKGKKRTGICGFFKRTWKGVKRPFRHKTRVEPIVPPLLPDSRPSHSDLACVPSTSGLQKTSSVFDPSAVSGASWTLPGSSVEVGMDEVRDDDELKVLSVINEDSLSADDPEEHNISLKDAVENSTQEEHVKKSKKKGICGFFKRTWKGVKRPFRHKTRVEPIAPPLLPDSRPSHSDLACVPSTSGEQISDPSAVSGPSRIQKHKGKKRTGICGFFKRTWKGVKHPFRHKTRVEPIVPPLLPDSRPSHSDLACVPSTSGLQKTSSVFDPSAVSGASWTLPGSSVEVGMDEVRDDDELKVLSVINEDSLSADDPEEHNISLKDAVENSTQEEHVKKSTGKGIRFSSNVTWVGVKHPSHCKTSEEPIVPPLLPDSRPSHSDLACVPSTSGLQKTSSVFDPSAVSGASWTLPGFSVEVGMDEVRDDDELKVLSVINEDSLSADDPEEHNISLKDAVENSTQEDHVKKSKKKGIRFSSNVTWVGVKHPSHCKTSEEPIVPPLLPDSRPSHSDLACVPSTSGLQKTSSVFDPSAVSGASWTLPGFSVEVGMDEVRDDDELKVLSVINEDSLSADDPEEHNISLKDAVENSTQEEHVKKSTGKGIRFSSNVTWVGVKHPSHCKTPEEPIVPPQASCKPSRGFVQFYYGIGNMLGKGGCGVVYEAKCLKDGKKVALKSLIKKQNQYLRIPGHSKRLLTEVALMLIMRQAPLSPYVVQMLEWFEDSVSAHIIMEYPRPCQTLYDLILYHRRLDEIIARGFMRQAVQAVQHCFDHKVFHSDIHSANILINVQTLELKLIDFGCGSLSSNSAYPSLEYAGANEIRSPEVVMDQTYHAVPLNVWQLGVLLYEMVNGSSIDYTYVQVKFENPNLSEECKSLIRRCLAYDPAKRPTLEQILQHRWFHLNEDAQEVREVTDLFRVKSF